ncbi:MAG: ATP synthase F1 subunit gamma [Lachnospiraceae bacterium]|nr:ATP synthase F1 subunit gamma [Lachnospiraceae bacterium]
MANAREIKQRIDSVRNTKKITNAMYLISSAKLRKAKDGLAKTRPYFNATEHEIKRIFQSTENVDSHYFYPEDHTKEIRKQAYLVITADRGLAGGYNHNVIRAAEEEMKMHRHVRLYVIGDYGRRYFKKHKGPIEETFYYTAQDPTFERAREISALLLDEYDSGRTDEITVIYSDMESELNCVVRKSKLLPFSRKDFLGKKEKNGKEYRFDPSPTAVLDSMIPSYVAGFIYGALVDSFSAEQNSRMNAMSNANRNAEELLMKLKKEYNRVRQAAITQQITEVSAGAKAQRMRRLRKARQQMEER